MRSKTAVLALSLLAGASLVASGLAQQPNPDRGPAVAVATTVPAGGQQPAQAALTLYGALAQSSDARPAVAGFYGDLARYEAFGLAVDPAQAELQAREATLAAQVDELTRQVQASESGDRKEVQDKLEDLLRQQFDLRQERHQKEIEALEAQVEKLKVMVERRQEKRSEIVSRRLEQIALEADGLGW